MRSRRASILLTGALALVGCGASTLQQGPSDTLRAYSNALEQGRADDAYKLLSGEARRSISPEAFRRMVKESPDEVREIARALARPSSDPVVTATVSSPSGGSLLLVYEGGQWRIDGSAIDWYAQTTPRQSIEAFLRAFEKRRWDVLVRFVPDAHLDGIDASKLKAAWETKEQADEMQRITSAIRAALPTAAIEETGDRATMAYGAGGTVQLVREHGVWKIEDFD